MSKKISSAMNEMLNGARFEPSTDIHYFECGVCKDTGLVIAPIGYKIMTPGWKNEAGISRPVEFIIGQDVDGSPYPKVEIVCEACMPKRIEKQKVKYQELSGMTHEERDYRLTSIMLTETRTGTNEMYQAGLEIVHGEANMITVYGKTGNAKSLLLLSIVNEFLDSGIPALYIRTSEMLEWIRDAFNPDRSAKEGGGSAIERTDTLKGIRVLCIDEAGAIKQTDWTSQILDELIDRRYRDALAQETFTVIAMNEHPSTLGDRIYSRMRDSRLRKNGSPIIHNNDSDVRPVMERKDGK